MPKCFKKEVLHDPFHSLKLLGGWLEWLASNLEISWISQKNKGPSRRTSFTLIILFKLLSIHPSILIRLSGLAPSASNGCLVDLKYPVFYLRLL
ncbi:hypothetical protein MHYP_G00169590 [Metynnis hypsauchen]